MLAAEAHRHRGRLHVEQGRRCHSIAADAAAQAGAPPAATGTGCPAPNPLASPPVAMHRAAPPPSPASPPAGSKAMRGERCRPCLGSTKQELPRPWWCTRVPRSIPPVHGRRPCRTSGHEAAACTRLLGERRLAPSMYWNKASNPHPWLAGERGKGRRENGGWKLKTKR
jgi:hypothetical protein